MNWFTLYLVSALTMLVGATVFVLRPSFNQFMTPEQILFFCVIPIAALAPGLNTLFAVVLIIHLYVTRQP